MTRTGPVALTITAAASWAAAALLTKVALQELTPLDILGVELFASALVMVILVAVRRGPVLPPNWRMFAALGALEPGLSFGLIDYGFSRTGAADGAILIASQGLFGVVLARLLLAERVSSLTSAAVAVGFTGSALVGLTATGHGTSTMGDLLVLAASAAAGVNGVGVRRLSPDADTLSATTTQLVAAALLVAPVVLITDTTGRTHLTNADDTHVLAAVAVGILGGAVPFLAFNRAIRDLSVARASVLLNLDPVLAAAGAVLLLGERLHWPQIIGGLLVISAATAIAAPETLRRKRHRLAGEIPCPSLQ